MTNFWVLSNLIEAINYKNIVIYIRLSGSAHTILATKIFELVLEKLQVLLFQNVLLHSNV